VQRTPKTDPAEVDGFNATGPEDMPTVAQTAHTALLQSDDFHAVFENIVSHGETLDNLRASQGYDEMGTVDTASLLPQGADLHLKTQSLPVLDNLVSSLTRRVEEC